MDITEFANTHFEGDIEIALQQLAYESYTHDYRYTGNTEGLQEIVIPLTGENAKKYMHYMGNEMEKNPKILKKIVDQGVRLGLLGMEAEEVISAAKNPFAKPILIELIVIFGAFSLLLLLAFIANRFDISTKWMSYASVSSILVAGGFGCGLATHIVKFFYFRKLKKELQEKKA